MISRLADLRDHLTQLQLQATVQREMLEVIEELESRLYAVEQDNMILNGKLKAQEEKNYSLNLRYSELLYRFGERSRGSEK